MLLRPLKVVWSSLLVPLVILGGSCARHPRAAQQPPQIAPSGTGEDFRAQIPMPAAKVALSMPTPTRVTLPNGLSVYLWPKRNLPLVRLSLHVKSGASDDPADAPGLASLTAEMLRHGTTSRSAEDVADQVETLGANLDSDAGEDDMYVSLSGLSSNLSVLLELLSDVTLHPSFTAKEVGRVKALRKGDILQAESSPGHIARTVFRKVVFGKHPYAHLPVGTRDGLSHIDGHSMKRFWQEHVRPANAAIVAVGDFDPAQLTEAITARFGAWRGQGSVERPAAQAPRPKADMVLVDRPGASQSQVLVGTVGLPRATPDYFAATLCNAVLGGMFNSRINMNLREDKGWTYGASSQMGMMRAAGPLAVAAGIRTDATGPAVSEILREMAGLREADITAEELLGAKNRFALSLPGRFESINAIASHVAELYLFDLPLDYYQQLPARMEAVTQADVRRMAETYLNPEAMNVVIVGDAKQVVDELLELKRGPVSLRDVRGRPLGKKVAPKAHE